MSVTTFLNSEFNLDVSKAKRATSSEPVIITAEKERIVELIAIPDFPEVEFEPERKSKVLYHPADFS